MTERNKNTFQSVLLKKILLKDFKFNLKSFPFSRFRLRLALTSVHLRGLIVTLPSLTVYHLHLSLSSMTVGDRPKSTYKWVINLEKR
jgi:hypothetical protein